MTTLTRRNGLALLSLAAPPLASPALAQSNPAQSNPAEPFPSRPMRFIVPVSAGGSADAQARTVAQRLSERWGQPVLVENRPGANGIVAAQAFLQTPPDGHTVYATPSGPIAINPHLYRRLPYDPFRDFAFASLISVIPLVLVAHPSLPANTLQEFLALSRQRGDALAHASAGIGTPSHLTIAMTRAMGQGGNPTHVPFGGSAPALTSLVSGHTMAMWDASFSAAPFVRDNRLKAIAVAHTERLALMPGVPTTAEQGATQRRPFMISLNVNNRAVSVAAEPQTPLLWVLREHLGLTGTKYGCGVAACGACTVHVDGEAVRSCSLPASDAVGKAITTIEGLPGGPENPLVRAWVAVEAPQCGYCQTGQIMQAATLLARTPQPSRQAILEHMDGNLCRCASYNQIVEAIQQAGRGA